MQGKLRIGFKYLTHAPYIKALQFGFVAVPTHHVSIKLFSPAGTNLTELPLINSWFKRLVDDRCVPTGRVTNYKPMFHRISAFQKTACKRPFEGPSMSSSPGS